MTHPVREQSPGETRHDKVEKAEVSGPYEGSGKLRPNAAKAGSRKDGVRKQQYSPSSPCPKVYIAHKEARSCS